MEQRAYTGVDPGTALVGNAWLERRWSAFLGQTIELRQSSGDIFWLDGQSPEVSFTLSDGRGFDVMTLGEVEWSEERSPQAATILLRKGSPEGLGVYIRTLALHETAALVREVRLFNTGIDSVRVRHVQYEVLPLLGARHPVTEGLAVLQGERGLLIGIEGEAQLSPGTPGGEALVVSHAPETTLARGTWIDLPPVFILPFGGGLGEHVAALAAKYHKSREVMRTWEEERAAAIREEAESN